MSRRQPDRFLQASAVLLVASALLIAPSLVGLGASLGLAAALVVLGAGLFVAREYVGSVGPVAGIRVGSYLRPAWVGSLAGALVTVAWLGATPGELQALGGMCGLVGMLNYFLQPVYGLVLSVHRRLSAWSAR